MSARAPTIGERGRHFTLEMPIEAPDGFGGAIRTWQPGPRLWGAITLLSASERVRADRPETAAAHRVTLAFRDGVSEAHRLTLGLRCFRIKAASDPDGTRRQIVCLVEEMCS